MSLALAAALKRESRRLVAVRCFASKEDAALKKMKDLQAIVDRPPSAPVPGDNVSTEEALSDEPPLPNRQSNTETLMPWEGWISRWFRATFGENAYNKWRNFAYYSPDDGDNLMQVPYAAKKTQLSNNDDPEWNRAYRTPSPGSQTAVRIPSLELDQDPYDIGYFKKDTRRRYKNKEFRHPDIEKAKLELMDKDDPEVQAVLEEMEKGPQSSPGNKGVFATGPTKFDPTGLRAAMSATFPELQKSLDKHMPDHLPTPIWWKNRDAIVAWYEERDLPPPIGGTGFGLVPPWRRIAMQDGVRTELETREPVKLSYEFPPFRERGMWVDYDPEELLAKKQVADK